MHSDLICWFFQVKLYWFNWQIYINILDKISLSDKKYYQIFNFSMFNFNVNLQVLRKEAIIVRFSWRKDKEGVVYVKFTFSNSLVKSRSSPRMYISVMKKNSIENFRHRDEIMHSFHCMLEINYGVLGGFFCFFLFLKLLY